MVLVASFAVVVPSSDAGRSTLERGREGTAALAEVLSARGTTVHSLRLGLHVLGRKPPGSVLVMIAGSSSFSVRHRQADVDRVLQFVRSGSTVVLLTDRPHPLARELGLTVDPRALDRPPAGTAAGIVAAPTVPHFITAGGPLALHHRAALEENDVGLPLFTVDGHVVATLLTIGAGHVFVVTDPFPATNAGIGLGGNLSALLAAIDGGLGADGVVLFDDLHAGASDEHGILAYARSAGLGAALFLAALTLGLFLWRASRREGAVLVPSRQADARASSELVLALAGLYERAGLTDHALDVISRRFRREMELRSGESWKRGTIRAWVLSELGAGATREFDDISRRFAEAFRSGDPDLDRVGDLADRVHRFQMKRLPRTRRGSKQGSHQR
jgi:hypothetical protein